MNKNVPLISHLQNAAIAVLTVTAVLLLIQTNRNIIRII